MFIFLSKFVFYKEFKIHTMYTTYHLSSAQEVTNDLLEAIKATFKSKAITITVEEEIDTTAYLLSNPLNKKILKKSIQQDKSGEAIVLKKL
jgi:hypothetical protein